MKLLVVLGLFSFVALVCSQNFAQIGTFEGTYEDPLYGGYFYLCQNGDILQGSFTQAGILIGSVSNTTATGRYWKVGINECSLGEFTFTLTDEGVSVVFTCNGVKGNFPVNLKKYDVFRPSDDQCALLYDGDSSVEGHWKLNNANQFIDVCIRTKTATDNTTIHASYDTSYNEGTNYPYEGYIAGYTSFSDKIFQGTWYQDFTAGAVLGFVNVRNELVLYFWTGLGGKQGGTIIDASEYLVPDYHWVSTYSHSLRTSFAQCNRFSNLQPYVLDALQYYQDGNVEYIYFAYNPSLYFNLQVGFEMIDYPDTNPNYDQIFYGTLANHASYLTVSVLAVAVSVLVSLF